MPQEQAQRTSTAAQPGCCAIIAAYNEGTRVGKVVEIAVASELFDQVLVVDDGSHDETAEAAKTAGAMVVIHEQNRGKPQALHTGLSATSSDLVVFLDADLLGVTREHLNALVDPVRTGSAQATLGVFRGGRAATTLAQKITPMLSGQRCMRRELLTGFDAWDSGYGIETELNHFLRRIGITQQLVEWHGAGQVMKEEKVGFLRGVVWRLKMFWQVITSWFRTKLRRP